MGIKVRGDIFREIDATNIDSSSSIDLPVPETDGVTESYTVEFEEVSADSEEKLDEKLEQMAIETLQESGAGLSENLGYEVVREYGDTFRKVGFVVVDN